MDITIAVNLVHGKTLMLNNLLTHCTNAVCNELAPVNQRGCLACFKDVLMEAELKCMTHPNYWGAGIISLITKCGL